MYEWISLSNRSYFSWGKGIYSPEDIVKRAVAQGCPYVAMTDLDNWAGMVRFIKSAIEHNIIPVPGVELSLNGQTLLTVYPKNRNGLALLNTILTRKNNDPSWYWPEAFIDGWEGLILVVANQSLGDYLVTVSTRDLYWGMYWGKPYYQDLKWAQSKSLPVVALNEVAWKEEDYSFYRLIRSLATHSHIDRIATSHVWGCMAGQNALYNSFGSIPDAISNQRRIASSSIGESFLYDGYIFPSFNNMERKEEYQHLKALCMEGLRKRYPDMMDVALKRLEYELTIIRDKGFSGYFLVVQDIVNVAPRTCGRGSAASSLVSYCLGITHVDPIRNHLFFDRFLNYGRIDPPDIDVDFPWDERDRIFEHIFKKYKGRSAMVADHVTYADHLCFREPAKAMGMEEEEISQILRWRHRGELEKIPPYIMEAAQRLYGMPRHLGTHPGGVVITPDSLYRTTSLHRTGSDYPLLPWDKDSAEDAGLIKIDILGNRSLSVLRDAITLINDHEEEHLEWEKFQPYQDTEARQLIEEGQTLGIFYVESPATRQLLRKMREGSYDQLVIASSIIRPAANNYINEYVARRKGKAWQPFHPSLKETLKDTMGLMVYQEDVSRVAMAAAGFSGAEADQLRKVLSKKNKRLKLKHYKESFYLGGYKQGLHKSDLDQLWKMILSFEGYSFCKAHSASYALISYRLAYIKARYERIFYLAVINNGGGYYNRQVYINALKRRGYQVLPPHINRSEVLYTLCEEGIIAGFSQIIGLTRDLIMKILEARSEAPFQDIGDFICRVQPSFGDMRLLIRSGTLDPISRAYTRPQLFWVYYHFKGNELNWDPPKAPSFIGDYDQSRKLRDEFDTLGVVLSTLPIQIYLPRVQKILSQDSYPSYIRSRDIDKYRDKQVTLAGAFVTRKWVRTKKKQDMSFVSFEDEDGIFETVFFPDSWSDYAYYFDDYSAFLISGEVKDELGALSVQVDHLIPISRMKVTT
ncbi:PHP domain-containing protein [Spirochaeta cellobiosiphila]|uniref:helix-hairpin-helix domain-containing protein n=1 Tax=Spirochaeta cellobiosiphila TaxID=504483 RepID=UPI000419387A|nr:PHP domain-containing protein [Spirochaeta cellobiosiphila]